MMLPPLALHMIAAADRTAQHAMTLFTANCLGAELIYFAQGQSIGYKIVDQAKPGGPRPRAADRKSGRRVAGDGDSR